MGHRFSSSVSMSRSWKVTHRHMQNAPDLSCCYLQMGLTPKENLPSFGNCSSVYKNLSREIDSAVIVLLALCLTCWNLGLITLTVLRGRQKLTIQIEDGVLC